MKYLITTITCLVILSCSKPTSEFPPKTVANAPSVPAKEPSYEMPSVKIDLKDRACIQDSDCDRIPTQCSCSCGEGVHKNFVSKYSEALSKNCENYTGRMCKVLCNGELKCVDKVCTYIST